MSAKATIVSLTLSLVTGAALAACQPRDDAGPPPPASGGARDDRGPAPPAAPGAGADDDGGAAAPAPAPVDAVLDRALTLVERVAEVAVGHADDCGALAAALDALLTEHQPLFDELARHGADPEVERRTQAWMATQAPRLDGAMTRARPALERCRGDARLRAVFDRLAGVAAR
ncbi:MAG: hypothetical protein KJZ91_08160 [Myxococcales bacterium]|nr:hypothetical protein [Myxococcales bacterium]